MKPSTFPRSVRQALGPHTRLELCKPTPRWRIVLKKAADVVAQILVAMLLGLALGGFLSLVERL